MTALAEPVVTPTLDELAATANREHALAQQAGTAMIGHAIAAGEALIAAREQVARGQWENWLREHGDYANRTAALYMRLARHRDHVIDAQATTLTDALRVIAGEPDSRVDPELRDSARRLYAQGDKTLRQVAAEVGTSIDAVWRYCNPEKQRAREERAKRRTQAGRRALLRQQRDSDVRKHGGDVAEAYSLTRKALQALERAAEVEPKPERRRAIRAAMDRLYKAEDEIVRAVRLS